MPSRLIIRSGILALPSGPARGDVLCEGGRIVAIGADLEPGDARVIEAGGYTVGPGLIDIHVHGGGGHSFFTRDAARIAAYSAWAPRNGVTAFLASTVGDDPGGTAAILAALAPAVSATAGAEMLGFHREGPFINPARRGAFPANVLRAPALAEWTQLAEAGRGAIRQVTIAPELPGALEIIQAIAGSGAVAALGHTDATTAECAAGFDAGIRHVTHLFNAMRPIHQREGGPIVAALLDDRVTCELICDGAHVVPELLRMAYRLLGPERAVVVTDNLHLAGVEATSGSFAGEEVVVSGAKAAKADGTIVGSVATMDAHFRNAMHFLGIDTATAFRLCSANPARVAGVGNRKGRLEPGFDADLVVLDEHLEVRATVCRGQVAFERR
ncbi:MAG TPA: N-acetylglucosamine-6-phosphate deacetylase [Tepidiformaceae bacterium]|nr:N-acetylglucosamine-6-phosphate deacetylase [Tepidiformaceae bacterium]